MAAENTPTPATPDTIVLIHGLWVTPRSWEKWVERYEDKGYRVLTPTDYKEFEGRSHYSVIGGEGWEEVADYALDWAEANASRPVA